jgi:hypothetical protein
MRSIITFSCAVLVVPAVSVSLQELKAHVADKLSLGSSEGGMSIDSMEAALIAMSNEKASPALLPFLDQINTLTSQMQAQIKGQYVNLQTMLNAAYSDISTCTFSPTAAYSLDNYSAALGHCRSQESRCKARQIEGCAQCNSNCALLANPCINFNNINVFPASGSCNLPPVSCDTLSFMQTLRDHFTQLYRTWNQSQAACLSYNQTCGNCVANCQAQTASCQSLTTQCNLLQHQMEAAACNQIYSSTCSSYQTCFTTKFQAWLNMNASITQKDASLSAELRGIDRIQCILNGFVGEINGSVSNLQNYLMQQCGCKQSTTNSTATPAAPLGYNITVKPTIKYVGCNRTIVMQNCSGPTVSPLPAPGSLAWIQRYYLPLNAFTTYDSCNAACCVACASSAFGCCTNGLNPKMSPSDTC